MCFLLQGHTKEGQSKEGQAKEGQAKGQAEGRAVHLRVTQVIPVMRQVCCATVSTTVIEELM